MRFHNYVRGERNGGEPESQTDHVCTDTRQTQKNIQEIQDTVKHIYIYSISSVKSLETFIFSHVFERSLFCSLLTKAAFI